jgi:hypothetical protein
MRLGSFCPKGRGLAQWECLRQPRLHLFVRRIQSKFSCRRVDHFGGWKIGSTTTFSSPAAAAANFGQRRKRPERAIDEWKANL